VAGPAKFSRRAVPNARLIGQHPDFGALGGLWEWHLVSKVAITRDDAEVEFIA
jgi:hypothetical protein